MCILLFIKHIHSNIVKHIYIYTHTYTGNDIYALTDTWLQQLDACYLTPSAIVYTYKYIEGHTRNPTPSFT